MSTAAKHEIRLPALAQNSLGVAQLSIVADSEMFCADTNPQGITLPLPGSDLTVYLEKIGSGENLLRIPIFENESAAGPREPGQVDSSRYVGELELDLHDRALVCDAPDGTMFELSVHQDEASRVTAAMRRPPHPPVVLPFRADVLRNSRRTLCSPLGISLIGVELCFDLYLTNPYRILGVSASAPEPLVAAAAQKLRNRLKLRRAHTRELSIQTGYDDLVQFSANDAADVLARLSKPRERALSDCFWLHLPAEHIAVISSQPSLGSSEVIEILNELASGSGDRAMIAHALAIAYHNRAIAAEVGRLPGTLVERDRDWALALRYWAETMSLDAFWRMLGDRISERNDPRVNQDHLLSLREDLPRAILAFNVASARGHAQTGAIDACSRQIILIANSDFDDAVKTPALKEATEALVGVRLGPLQLKVQGWSEALETKTAWHDYGKGCEPLVAELLEVSKWVGEDRRIPAGARPFVVFDKLVELISQKTRSRIEYNDEERPRALLYDLEVHMRMKSLPVSAEVARQVDEATREVSGYFAEYLPPPGGPEVKAPVDPFDCWFLAGARASVAGSVIVRLYKFDTNDDEEVSIDTLTWTKKAFLVPRSNIAMAVHEGRTNVEDIAKQYLDAAANETVRAIRNLQERTAAIRLATLQSQEQEMSVAHLQEARVIQQRDQESAASSDVERTKVAKARLDTARFSSEAKAHLADAVQSAEQAHTAGIQAEEERYQDALARYQGFSGILRVPVVTGLVAALVLTGARVASANYGLSISSLLADTVLVALGLSGLIAGGAAGEAIRRRNVSNPFAALCASRQALADKKSSLSAQCELLIATQSSQAAQVISNAEAELKQIEAARLKFMADSDGRIESLKRQHQAAVNELDRNSAIELGQLRHGMDRYLRPEADKLAFPGIASAIEQGYVVGSRPTEEEISRETTARAAAIAGVASASVLITRRNATTAMLKSTLQSAFGRVKQQGDWLGIETDCGVWIRLQSDLGTVSVQSIFTFMDFSTENQRLKAVAAMNTGYGIIRASVAENSSLIFDYDIPLDGGIFKASLVQAIRRFGSIPQAAVRSHCAGIVK